MLDIPEPDDFVPEGWITLKQAIDAEGRHLFGDDWIEEDFGARSKRSWSELRQSLYRGDRVAVVLAADGKLYPVPRNLWGSEECNASFRTGRASVRTRVDLARAVAGVIETRPPSKPVTGWVLIQAEAPPIGQGFLVPTSAEVVGQEPQPVQTTKPDGYVSDTDLVDEIIALQVAGKRPVEAVRAVLPKAKPSYSERHTINRLRSAVLRRRKKSKP